jgi:MFS family permease
MCRNANRPWLPADGRSRKPRISRLTWVEKNASVLAESRIIPEIQQDVQLMSDNVQQHSYRWVIVVAAAFILAISMGAIVNGMSAFIVPMQDANGWQRGDVSLINFSGIIGLAFGGMALGRWADRVGTRPVVLFGVVVLGLCYCVAYFATALWHYYALFFVAGFFGTGAIFSPVMASVGSWFSVGMGTAIGIASAGQAMGQGGVPFVSSFLIKAFGVNGAFGATGLFMLVTLVPLAMLLRQPPAAPAGRTASGPVNDAAQIPVRTVIIRMSIATILCCSCMSVPLMHLVPLIQDRGFAAEQASSVIFVMLLVAIAGRLAFGRLADMIGAVPAYMTATAWMTLMVFGFIYIDSLSGFYTYAVIYGFGYAGVMTGVLVTMSVLTPTASRASAVGIVTMFAWFGHAIGGYQGGALYDLTGSYTLAYALAAIAGVLNLIVVSTLYWKSRDPGQAAVAA